MTAPSLVIRNANIVDGRGNPGFFGDVGIAGDCITAIGAVPDRGVQELDAKGQTLAPGFIDIHTHYDPQLCWDRLASPSPEHGVTTVVAGNCSLSLAPVRPEGRQKITRLFGTVEDFEASVFEQAVPFSWESFDQYLAYLRMGLGPNVGMLVGHGALRLYVMGAAAQERAATASEIAEMSKLLREAMEAGALGLSMTLGHLDENGGALPSFYSAAAERYALARSMAETGRGVLEIAPNFMNPPELLSIIDELGELSLATGITCSISPVLHLPLQGDLWSRQLTKLQSWQACGAKIFGQSQTRPVEQTFRLSRGSAALSKLPTWSAILGAAMPGRLAAFSDHACRPILERELMERFAKLFEHVTVKSVHHAENKPYTDRKLFDIARSESRTVTDVMLDIAIKDGLETDFELSGVSHADPEMVSLLLAHPAIHIGAADAGAHIAQFAGAGDTSYFLEKFVRELGYFTLEHAVQLMTGTLARDWHIRNRGEIVEGWFADLVIFDPATVARGAEEFIADVPGGSGRYVRRPKGISTLIVNGEILVKDGAYTAARPGRIV